MSPLPQRRKSAEELAQLRESLGIPDAAPPPPGSQSAPPPAPPIIPPTQPEPARNLAPLPLPPAKPVRSLKRSERTPATQPRLSSPAGHSIPARRRSDEEIAELRRQQALAIQPPVAHLNAITAHWILITLGYLLSLAGGIGGVAIALFIWRKKPRSVHHAAFMAVIALFVIVFGSLYLFPQLRNDT